MKKITRYFTKTDIIIWSLSISLIVLSFVAFDRENFMTFVASLIGVTALIFCAKGNPFGQLLMLIFCVYYGFISYTFSYYGEMLTYLLMTAPMAVFSLISWMKNPYRGNRAEVTVNKIRPKEIFFMLGLSVAVTVVFYFILDFFGTANIVPSTFSVTTSFIAVYLTFRRSPYFALAYAANDVVLIVLWTLAALEDISYLSVIICFAVFLLNDIYGFVSWLRMQKKQQETVNE